MTVKRHCILLLTYILRIRDCRRAFEPNLSCKRYAFIFLVSFNEMSKKKLKILKLLKNVNLEDQNYFLQSCQFQIHKSM